MDGDTVDRLYDALGNHRYKKIESRKELVLLAVALHDRLTEVEGRYAVALEEVRHLDTLCEVNAIAAAEPGHG
jgi:hypothetical protein